jgi:hypothetical protein
MLAHTGGVPLVEIYLAWLVAIVLGLPAAINADRKPRKARLFAGVAVIGAIALLVYGQCAHSLWQDTLTGWAAVEDWLVAALFFLGPCSVLGGIVLWRTRTHRAAGARNGMKKQPPGNP